MINNKYQLKEGHETVITRTSDGTQIVVTKGNFNDEFGEMMFRNNQQHLLHINPTWTESDEAEKKSYVQISETVILLTSSPDEIGKPLLKEIVKEPELKRKRGRQPKKLD